MKNTRNPNGRNSAFQHPFFTSKANHKKDFFCSLHESLLKSLAYQDLSPQAKTLYTYCTLQVYLEEPKPLKGNNYSFTMNKDKAEKYGLIKHSGQGQLYKWINSLIEHGFIDCFESGKNTCTKSIYTFSERWKTWKPGTPPPYKAMTTSLIKKYRGMEEKKNANET